jgi:hypothetical protein
VLLSFGPHLAYTSLPVSQLLTFGLDTFGDITADADGRPLARAEM